MIRWLHVWLMTGIATMALSGWAADEPAVAAAEDAAKLAEASTPEPSSSPAVFLAMEKAVSFFRTRSTNDVDGWFMPPYRRAQIVGRKMRDIHYKDVELPVYEYESYEELVPGASPSDPLRKVVRNRIKRQIPGKTRTVRVEDPSGSIVVQEERPVWDKGGPDDWGYGKLGVNAMVLLALNRAGLQDDDPMIAQVAGNLATIVERLGVPDMTWDAAWLTAAFSVMPGDRFSNLTATAASKLMDGQIGSGPCEGMWGPLCMNHALYGSMLKAAMPVSERVASLDKLLNAQNQEEPGAKKRPVQNKVKESNARIQSEVDKLKNDLSAFQTTMRQVSWLGMSMFSFYVPVLVKDEFAMTTIMVAGAPYLFYNQTTADLESTSLVLMALRMAAESGRLPEEVVRPEIPKVVRTGIVKPSILAPVRATNVISRAAEAIRKARTAEGAWSEMNRHQPVIDYLWLRSIPTAATAGFMELPSPVTGLSSLAGRAGLQNARLALGQGKGEDPAAANPGTKALVEWLDGKQSIMEFAGATNAEYAALFYLEPVRGGALGSGATQPSAIWLRAADWLTRNQHIHHGSWGSWIMPLYPTSIRARRQILPSTEKNLHDFYDKPHVIPAMYHPQSHNAVFCVESSVPCTAYALMMLANGAGASVQPAPVPPEPVAEPAVEPAVEPAAEPVAAPAAETPAPPAP